MMSFILNEETAKQVLSESEDTYGITPQLSDVVRGIESGRLDSPREIFAAFQHLLSPEGIPYGDKMRFSNFDVKVMRAAVLARYANVIDQGPGFGSGVFVEGLEK